jgi:hypothetical protein
MGRFLISIFIRFCGRNRVKQSNTSPKTAAASTNLALGDALGSNFEDCRKQHLQREKQVQHVDSRQDLPILICDADAHQIQHAAYKLPVPQRVLHLTNNARPSVRHQQEGNRLGATLYRGVHQPIVVPEPPVFSALVRNHRDKVQHVRPNTASVLPHLLLVCQEL